MMPILVSILTSMVCQTIGQLIGLTDIVENQELNHEMMDLEKSELKNCSLDQSLNLSSDHYPWIMIQNKSNVGDTCIAPTGMWGPVCTSVVGLMGLYPDQLIQYNVYPAIPDTPVYCKLLGMACYAYNAPCCFTLHPRTNTGYPSWGGAVNTLIWGNTAGSGYVYPQIQCFSTGISTAVSWTWTSTMGTGVGCYNGTNCNVFGC